MKEFSDSEQRIKYIAYTTLLVLAVILIATCGWWGVIESSEARYAEISWEMFTSHDLVNPKLLAISHYHKPPLTYWLTAASFNVFGPTAFGTRILLQISLIIQALLVFKLCSKLFDSRTALIALAVYCSFPLVLVAARGLTTDSFLTTFVLAAIYTWSVWKSTGKPLWLYAAAVLLGLAFLTKGPVALIVPVFGGWAIYKSVNQVRGSTGHVVGAVMVFLLVAGAWFGFLMMKDRSFVDYFIMRHTVDRFAAADVFTRKQPWWYFIVWAPLTAMPAILSPLFSKAVYVAKRNLVKRLWIGWIGLPLIFFSLSSSKLLLYVLPVFPGLAILCAVFIARNFAKEKALIMTLVIFVSSIALILSVAFALGPADVRDPYVAATAMIFVIIPAIVSRGHASFDYKIIRVHACWIVFLIAVSTVFLARHEGKSNSTRSVAEWIERHNMQNRNIVVYNQLLPSLAFGLQKDIVSLNNGHRYLQRETQFEKDSRWRKQLIDIRTETGEHALDSIVSKPTVVIASVRDEPDDQSVIKQRLRNKVLIDKWVLFYN